MKKLFTLLAIVFLTVTILAQSPEFMSYQAVIRNNSNNLTANVTVGMKISILQGTEDGTVVYTETHTATTNANGLVSLEIGTGTTSNDFSAIDWENGSYFIKTETDLIGGSNYTIVGTSKLLSVPYSLFSKTAGNVFDGQWTSLTSVPTTLAGHGITDGMNTSHAANGITSGLMDNWATAFGWGDHDGLYRPIGYVPTWNEVTGKPTFATVATSGSYTDLINTPTISGSQWTPSGSDIYYNSGNVGIGTNSPATSLHVHGSPISSRGQLSLSAPAGEGIFLSMYDADIFKAYLWYDVSAEDLRLQNFTAGDLNLNPYGGNVGIGTDNPGYTLDVTGDINFTGSLYQDGSLFSGGSHDHTGETFTTSSESYALRVSSTVTDNGAYYGLYATAVDDFGCAVIGHEYGYYGHGLLGIAYGENGSGVSGRATTSTGRGAYGYATASTGATYGVYGEVDSPTGWGLYTPDRLYVGGNVGIGTTSPMGSLDVNGPIYQRGGVLHADYVFEPDYHLETIEDHSEFMWQNKHLKAIPKAKMDESSRQIVEVGSHRKGIVEELEKAHIYIDQLNNRIKSLEETVEKLVIRLDGDN